MGIGGMEADAAALFFLCASVTRPVNDLYLRGARERFVQRTLTSLKSGRLVSPGGDSLTGSGGGIGNARAIAFDNSCVSGADAAAVSVPAGSGVGTSDHGSRESVAACSAAVAIAVPLLGISSSPSFF